MNLGDRNMWNVVRAPFQRRHWLALGRITTVFTDPVSGLVRYATTAGDYPWTPTLRTPTVAVRPTLYSFHDVRTVNEVFCRHDYGDGDGAMVVADIGANIGISALFWLTRRPDARVHCFEPDPKNLDRLRANLAPFADRTTIHAVAVTPSGGPVTFVTEPSGRYGHIDRGAIDAARPLEERVEVEGLSMAGALQAVIDAEGRLDLVKIDTEGIEPDLVAAIPDDLRAQIPHLYYEDNEGGVVHLRSTS